MSMTLSGSGTITGLVAGGLPDGVITGADIAAGGATDSFKTASGQTGAAPVYGARAWCVFDGTLTGTFAPTSGGNVTSITKHGAGDYTVNMTTAMPIATYAVVITVQSSTQAYSHSVSTTLTAGVSPTTTSFRFDISYQDDNNSGVYLTNSPRISVVVFC